jgi:molybdenum cofactor cytidylyltransferase
VARDLPLRDALAIRRPALLALTLAVRQATAYDLAVLLAAEGLRVVVSATVPTALPHAASVPATLHLPDNAVPGDDLGALLAAHSRLAVLGVADRPDRVRGLAPAVVRQIAARPDVDAVIVIADGSRHRPVKAPAEHEPALPPGATHVLPMLGLAALGQPLAEEHAHRPEILAALLGAPAGRRLTLDDLAALLSPRGGRQGAPAGAAYWPILYGVGDADQAAAEDLAARLLAREGVSGVLLQRKGDHVLAVRSHG